MKELRVRPRYEIGEYVVIEQSGISCSRWYKVEKIQVIFAAKDRTIRYTVKGANGSYTVDQYRLANYHELIGALGVLQAMRAPQVPKFKNWVPRFDKNIRDLIANIQDRLKEHHDATNRE